MFTAMPVLLRNLFEFPADSHGIVAASTHIYTHTALNSGAI
jgi:hypothetical protein